MTLEVTHINIHRNISPDLIPYSHDMVEVFTNAHAPMPTVEEDGFGIIEFSVEYGVGVEFCQKNYPGVKIYLNEYDN